MTSFDHVKFFDLVSGGGNFQNLTMSNAPTSGPEPRQLVDAATFALNTTLLADEIPGDLFAEARINNGAEGAGIPIIFGPFNAVPVQWLYATDIWPRLVPVGEIVGEIIENFQNPEDIEVFCQSIIGVCGIGMGPDPGKRKLTLHKIWTDGVIAWDENVLFFGDAINDTVITGSDVTAINTTLGAFDVLRLEVPEDSNTDLAQIIDSQISNVQVRGFTESGNNLGTLPSPGGVEVLAEGIINSGPRINGQFMTLKDDGNTAVDEAEGDSITITQDLLDFRQLLTGNIWNGFANPIIPGLTVEPAIVFWDGVTNTVGDQDLNFQIEQAGTISNRVTNHIAHRSLSYIWFDMCLDRFNGKVPKIRVEVGEVSGELNNTKGLNKALADLLRLGGLASCESNFDGVTGNLRGYVLKPPISLSQAIAPILTAYDITPYEADGKIYFIDRGSERVLVVPDKKLAAHQIGDDAPRPILMSGESGFDAPNSVTVKYFDVNNRMDPGAETERRQNGRSPNHLQVKVPLTLTSAEARSIAHRILWQAQENKRRVSFNLPPSYLHVHEQDILRVTVEGHTVNCLVTEVNEGANWMIEVSGLLESRNPAYGTVAGQDSAGQPGNEIYVPPFMILEVYDLAPLGQNHARQSGIYHARVPSDDEAEFAGATLWSNTTGVDDVENYSQIDSVGFRSRMGYTTTALGAPSINTTGLFDRGNSVTIRPLGGTTLFSSSEAAVLGNWNNPLGFSAGATNVWRIGDEIIAFTDVVDNGDGTYTVSNLLRGLRNTLGATGGHATNEPAISVNSISSSYAQVNPSLYDTAGEFFFRILPTDGQLSAQNSVSFTPSQGMKKPFQVTNLEAIRGPSNDDIYLRWFPKTRGFTRELVDGYIEEDNVFGNEFYEIDVLDDLDALVDTKTGATDNLNFLPTGGNPYVLGYRFYDYTEALQTGDGFTPGDEIRFRVRKRFGSFFSDNLQINVP